MLFNESNEINYIFELTSFPTRHWLFARLGVAQEFFGSPLIKSQRVKSVGRAPGEGGVYWEGLSRDTERDKEIWRFFVETFEYQWTRNSVSLDEALEDALYEESQGIVDIAIKLFMTQWRAVALETEVITPALIRQVAAEAYIWSGRCSMR